MQHIYAYKQCQRSNYQLAFEYVHDTFQPDLNSMEVQDKVSLARDEKLATGWLNVAFDNKEAPADVPAHVRKVAQDAIIHYEKQCLRDREFLRQQMVSSTERIGDHYILLLLLLAALGEESGRERQKKFHYAVPEPAATPEQPKLNFNNNRVVQAIRQNSYLQTKAKDNNLHWEQQQGDIRQWYKHFVKPDETFQAYQATEKPALEEDVEIARYVFNNIILQQEAMTALLEENDINWSENKKAIKSMANKSIKTVTEERPDYIEVVELTPNWEDDRTFMENLYEITLRHDEEYEHIISEKSRNWSADRIAHLDNVIIKMAIAEMIHFSSIPVKVTINEYIDISKQYSTHKSKQFVNGMLDVIATDLQKQNLIRKSGRGLIDNR